MVGKSKVALVTAAGRGLGEAIARALASDGYELALMSSGGGAGRVAQELGVAVAVRGSVTDPHDLRHLVEAAADHYGRIDAVVNNTGHPPTGPLLSLTDADWQAGFELVLLNVIRMAGLVTPWLRAEGGSIVNISTFSAFEPSESFPISSTLRAALGAYTKLYADAHAAEGIRMNSVLPGYMDSYPETKDLVAQIPAGRFGKVDELAAVVRFLVSDESTYLTGQNIRVDGGLTRSL